MIETNRLYLFTQILTLLTLLLTLYLGLLPALLAGFLIYQLTVFGGNMLVRAKFAPLAGRALILFLIAVVVLSAFGLGIGVFASQVMDGPESITLLLQRMADVVDTGRSHLPVWVQEHLPANIEEWQVVAATWLRENAQDLRIFGKDAGIFIFHLVVGMIIGGMVALSPAFRTPHGPLAQSIRERVVFFNNAFRRIVFSQIRISALNTLLTAIFLAGILPIMGTALPLTKTMIAVTFFAGLLPIIGNLISNTVIFLIALSVSPMAAVGSLIYLVFIHKLEYFMNARIIGFQIRARAWEILISMIIMEASFGIAGLVAAPIYYAYLKDELVARKLI
ncbi:MAG: AI-2E family transporter [Alphaproteobacteria bacterium]